MKSSFLVLFILFIAFLLPSIGLAQNNIDLLKINNQKIKEYSDSLLYFDHLHELNKINETEYQLSIYRVASELSIYSGSDVETTYAIADSMIYNNYRKDEKFQENESTKSNEDNMGGSNSMDNSAELDSNYSPPKAKRNIAMSLLPMILPNDDRRTNAILSLGFGFNGLVPPRADNTYPDFNPLHSFSFQNIMFTLKTRLGHEKSKISVRYGFGFDYLSLSQSNDIKILTKLNDIPSFESFVSTGQEKLKRYCLRVNYFKLPLGFSYEIKKKIDLRFGAFYNIAYKQAAIEKLEDLNGNTSKITVDKNLGFNKNIVGLEYALRYHHYELFFEHSLNGVLNSNALEGKNYFKVGINLR